MVANRAAMVETRAVSAVSAVSEATMARAVVAAVEWVVEAGGAEAHGVVAKLESSDPSASSTVILVLTRGGCSSIQLYLCVYISELLTD